MSAFFASLLLGFLSFLLLVNLFSIRIPKQLALQKRLEEIKDRNGHNLLMTICLFYTIISDIKFLPNDLVGLKWRIRLKTILCLPELTCK